MGPYRYNWITEWTGRMDMSSLWKQPEGGDHGSTDAERLQAGRPWQNDLMKNQSVCVSSSASSPNTGQQAISAHVHKGFGNPPTF